MGFPGKGSGGGGGVDAWGMGFLLVLFPEEDSKKNSHQLLSPSASSSSSSSPNSLKSNSFRILRTSSSGALLSRAQSTISICALLVFLTLLVFTLCTFEPSLPSSHHIPPRRSLAQKSPPVNRFDPKPSRFPSYSTLIGSIFGLKSPPGPNPGLSKPSALQGMGILYRRGTKAMNDLVIGHVPENATGDELRFFLRLLHRSGLPSKSDIVLIFPAAASPYEASIREENDSFMKLLHRYRDSFRDSSNSTRRTAKSAFGFDATQFVKPGKGQAEQKEPLWGKRTRSNVTESTESTHSIPESDQLSYGSLVGFEAAELDPEDALAAFVDRAPIGLRRWACYQMLLGRVRRNFKHVMLADAKNAVVTRDPLGRVRGKSSESVVLFSGPKHGHRSPDPSPAVIMGGARGIRRLAAAAVVEIVRVSTQRKGKGLVSESTLLSQLAQNEYVLKSVRLSTSAGSIPDASSLGKLSSRSPSAFSRHGVILRGSKNYDLESVVMKEICSHEHDFFVYDDCVLHRN